MHDCAYVWNNFRSINYLSNAADLDLCTNTQEQVPLGRLCCRPSHYTSSAIVKINQDVKTKQEIHIDKDMKFSFLY